MGAPHDGVGADGARVGQPVDVTQGLVGPEVDAVGESGTAAAADGGDVHGEFLDGSVAKQILELGVAVVGGADVVRVVRGQVGRVDVVLPLEVDVVSAGVA